MALTTAGNRQDAQRTQRDLKLTFPLIPAPVQRVAEQYGVWDATRGHALATLVIDKTGLVRYPYQSATDYDRPKAAKVLEVLRDIHAGRPGWVAEAVDRQALVGSWKGEIDLSENPPASLWRDGAARVLIFGGLQQTGGKWVAQARYGLDEKRASPVNVLVGQGERLIVLFDTQAGSRVRLALSADRKTLVGTFSARGDTIRKMTLSRVEP